MSWAVVGAGYSGIAVAGAMLAAGIEIDLLDARGEPGGLWIDGVYDDVRLITSRRVTAFPGHPMPAGDVFPTGPELLAYLQSEATRAGVTVRKQHVEAVTRVDGHWDLDGAAYDGVVLATGLFTRPRVPTLPGELTIPALHTADYKHVSQLGHDVLVVGLGNSGADVAQACAASGRRVTLAAGRGRHVVPRRVLGRPVVELRRPSLVPDLVLRAGLDATVRLTSAFWRTGRLGEPGHLMLAETPVVHSALLPLVRRGSVRVRPGVVALLGDEVEFSDGTVEGFDTVVWATGYHPHLPIARRLVDPYPVPLSARPLSLVGGVWSSVSPGLALVGLREPRHGRGAYLAAQADLVVAGALAQGRHDAPVGGLLAQVQKPDATWVIDDTREIPRLHRLTQAAARL